MYVPNEIHETIDQILEIMLKSKDYFVQDEKLFVYRSGRLKEICKDLLGPEITRVVNLQTNSGPTGFDVRLTKALYKELLTRVILPSIFSTMFLT